jgi:multiple sugar transport system permease protein
LANAIAERQRGDCMSQATGTTRPPAAPRRSRVAGRVRPVRRRFGRRPGRHGYLIGAVCLALCTVMLLPLLASLLASVKPTAEAAASPPTYLPTSLSLDSYERLWSYQQGLPTYLANSFGAALLTIIFTLLLTVPAAYALARFPVPGREVIFVVLLLALIVPYQALLTPMFLMFARMGLTNSLIGLAIVHTTIQLPFSLYVLRNSFAAVPRELEEAAIVDGANSFQALRRVFLPAAVPAVVTVALFAFIMSWNEFLGALVMMSKSSKFTLPLVLAAARTETSLGGTDWGMLQAGITISIVPCVGVYLLLQRYYVSGLMSGAVK